MLDMRVAIENIGAGFRRDRVLQFPHLGFNAAKVVRGTQRLFNNRRSFVKIRNLIERADFQTRLPSDRAGVRLMNSADDFEERSLPCAIGADESYFFCGIYLESDVPKYVLRTERLRDAIKLYDHALSRLRGFLCCRDLAGVLEDFDSLVQLTIFLFWCRFLWCGRCIERIV